LSLLLDLKAYFLTSLATHPALSLTSLSPKLLVHEEATNIILEGHSFRPGLLCQITVAEPYLLVLEAESV